MRYLTVTQADIDAAAAQRAACTLETKPAFYLCRDCPVARAAQRQFNLKRSEVFVDHGLIETAIGNFLVTAVMLAFIERFDAGRRTRPHRFRLPETI